MKKGMNSKGMTLVEVIVSMVIFCLATLCILTAFTAAIRVTNKTKVRDVEVAAQANVLEKKNQKQNVSKSADTYTITFTPTSESGGGTATSVPNVSLFTSTMTDHSSSFDFNIKSFGTGGFDGNETIADPANNEYKINVVNNSSEGINYTVRINDGAVDAFIYEGKSTSGYICSSKTYTRSVAANSETTFGYYDDCVMSDPASYQPSVSFTNSANIYQGGMYITNLNLQSCTTTNVVTITIAADLSVTTNCA